MRSQRSLGATLVLMAGLCLAGALPLAAAQEQGSAPVQAATLVEVVLHDGSRLYGTIVSDDPGQLVVRTPGGAVVTVPRQQIRSLRPATGRVEHGEYLPPDDNATRLIFGPTARSLGRGKAYLGVYEFLMPFVQVGVTDRFSIGGGTPLLFGFDAGQRPFWITPKLQIVNGARTQVAVGAFQILGGGAGGVGYVVASHGGARGSLTAGAGMTYGVDGGRSRIVMLGGQRQVKRNLALISESYLWGHGRGVASGGIRLLGDRLSADLALGVPLGVSGLAAFPVANFVYAF
ncbi:MAG: hypothetical protein ABJC51_09355 [Acidobacteriota bacterium]